jgi:single-strand DNA-binding protein
MRRFTVIGNLTKDAEVKDVKNRKAINFNIAHNETFKDNTGEKIEKTTYYSATIWRDSNVNVSNYLTKGTKVLIEGVPEPEMYRDKSGNMQCSIKILVSNLELIGGGSGNKLNNATDNSVAESNQGAKSGKTTNRNGDVIDDLPF